MILLSELKSHDTRIKHSVAAGELDVCIFCDSSPHAIGCPEDQHYDDAMVAYLRVDAPEDVGTARYWVDETFREAARDAGLNDYDSLQEGIAEFGAALRRGDIRRR